MAQSEHRLPRGRKLLQVVPSGDLAEGRRGGGVPFYVLTRPMGMLDGAETYELTPVFDPNEGLRSPRATSYLLIEEK